MKKIILLFSHILTKPQEEELKKEWMCNEIIYMPDEIKNKWAGIDETIDLEIFKEFLKANLKEGDLVLIQGEWGATYHMINFSKQNKYIPIYSTTERNSEEVYDGDKVIKKSIFLHKKFIKY